MTLRRLGELLHDAGLDLSVSGLSRLEHGDRPVTVDELVTLADVLDQAPADLLEQETVITGGGDLRMRLDRHDIEPGPPVEPVEIRPVIDPKLMEAIASMAVSAELRGLMQMLAATTVTPSTTATLRAVSEAATAGLQRSVTETMAPFVRAMERRRGSQG